MNLFQAIAPVVSHGATIVVVVSLLAAWAAVSAYFLRRATRKLKSALKTATSVISEAKNPFDFRERYEEISARTDGSILGSSARRKSASILATTRLCPTCWSARVCYSPFLDWR